MTFKKATLVLVSCGIESILGTCYVDDVPYVIHPASGIEFSDGNEKVVLSFSVALEKLSEIREQQALLIPRIFSYEEVDDFFFPDEVEYPPPKTFTSKMATLATTGQIGVAECFRFGLTENNSGSSPDHQPDARLCAGFGDERNR